MRQLVLRERERRAERRAAIADAFDELWSWTGTDYARLAQRLAESHRS